MASGDDRIDVMEGTSSSGEAVRRYTAQASEDEDDDRDKSSLADKTMSYDVAGGMAGKVAKSDRKIGHRRVGEGGEITYKKIQSTQIMNSIQLGIQHAVGGLASKPERDLLMQDFMTVETTNFPHEGSNHTPAHHYSEFRFRTYAPIAFRYFRDLFGIQPDDFLMSMCSSPLRELSNPGASGSIFYLTQDDEFIIKTVQHKEGEFLQKLLPGYYMNLNQNPRTLLPKFFGLYCYQCNSKNVRLVAMNNLLPSVVKLHQKYDLKGSTYKRKASKSERNKASPTYKDLDFMEHHPEGIFLEADTYGALIKTIQRDCRVLESFKIMDYSLLVGIHNLDDAQREKTEARRRLEGGQSDDEHRQLSRARSPEASDTFATQVKRTQSINRQRLVAHSTAMESIQAESEPIDEEDDVPPGGIPARSARGERLLLFVGVIDILQSYRLRKKLEHTWKSMIHDGDTVSVHRPGFYAQRFLDFMAKTVFKKIPSPLKHSPSKRKSITRPLRPTEEVDTPGKIVSIIGKPIVDYKPSIYTRESSKVSPRSSLRSSLSDFTATTESTWHQPPVRNNEYPSVLSDRLKNIDLRGPIIRSQESGDRIFQNKIDLDRPNKSEHLERLSEDMMIKLYPSRPTNGSLADSGIHTDNTSTGIQHVNISIIDNPGPSLNVATVAVRSLRDIGVDTRNENSLQDIPFIDDEEVNELDLNKDYNNGMTKHKSMTNISERHDPNLNSVSHSRDRLSSSLNRSRSPTFIDRCKKFFSEIGIIKNEDGTVLRRSAAADNVVRIRSSTPEPREAATLPKNMRIMSEDKATSSRTPPSTRKGDSSSALRADSSSQYELKEIVSQKPHDEHATFVESPEQRRAKSLTTLKSEDKETSTRTPTSLRRAESPINLKSSLKSTVTIYDRSHNRKSDKVIFKNDAISPSSILIKPGSKANIADKKVAMDGTSHVSVIEINGSDVDLNYSKEKFVSDVQYITSTEMISHHSGSTIVLLQPPD